MYIIQFQLILVIILRLGIKIAQGDSLYDNRIFVNQTGSSDRSCWEGNYRNPCSSVNLALRGLRNRTVIYIQTGSYNLTNDDSINIKGLSHIGIIGNSSADEVVIHCEQNAGLSFNISDNIEVRSLSFVKCGAKQVSASKNVLVKQFEFVQFRVAIYVLFCIDVTIDSVDIKDSVGTGLVMYNVAGDITVANSIISETKPYASPEVGAGGLHIEFTYCVPGNTDCQNQDFASYVPKMYSSNSRYFIHKNYIHSNKASLGRYYDLYRFGDQLSRSMEFGRGGGLSIIFKGNATNNIIIIDENVLTCNHAHHGGGFYFAIIDGPINNSIHVFGLVSSRNSVSTNNDVERYIWNSDGGGGGGKIMIYCSMPDEQHNNITISNSIFYSNNGITGGGLDIELDYLTPMLIELNNVTILNNSAFLGAAMYVVEKAAFIPLKHEVNLSLMNCSFSHNTPICTTTVESSISLPCSGVLYLSSKVRLELRDEVIFANNNASALELHSSEVYFAPQARVIFENNTSDYGGAIALYDCSYLLIDYNVTILFMKNSAHYDGGAIYAEKCGLNEHTAGSDSLCFLENDPRGENLTFYENTASGKPNAIYVGSVMQCYASSGKINTSIPTVWNTTVLNEIFCWDYFHFEDSNNCTVQRKSDPVFMEILPHSGKKVYPGKILILPIGIYDGWHTSLQTVSLLVCVYSGPVILDSQHNQQLADCVTTINKEVTIYLNMSSCSRSRYSNHNFQLKVSVNENKQLSIRLSLYFAECPKPLLTMDKQCSQCTFRNSLLSSSLHCSSLHSCSRKNIDGNHVCNVNSYVYVSRSSCVSSVNGNNNKTNIVIGNCPHYYPNPTFCIHILNLTDSKMSLRDSCSSEMSGRLCGRCLDGGIAINSPSSHCGICHELSGLIYFSAQILPLTIFILFIFVFHITITSPGMNALMFFSQMITLDFPGSMYPSWIRDANVFANSLSSILQVVSPMTLPYSIWNLNFLIPLSSSNISVCFSNKMNTIETIGLQYVIALYPLILLLFLYIWICFYENGIRPIHYITRPIHRILARMWRALEITPSLMDGCAVLFIICFTKIALTSLKLLHYTTWYSLDGSQRGTVFYYDGSIDYFQTKHLGFGIAAMAFLLIFVACPTICFLLYPCMWFQKLLDKSKVRYHGLVVISDIFMGTFRDRTMSSVDYRYCAGFYLLFRIFCICLYYIPNVQVLLIVETGFSLIVAGFFMICRPYKQNIINLIDFSIFLLLSILSALCLIDIESDSHLGLRISAGLLFVPFIVFSVYVLYLLLKRVQKCATKCLIRRRERNNVNPDYEQNSDEEPLLDDDHLAASFADRIENPNRYQQHNQPNIPHPLSDDDCRLSSEATGYTHPTHHSNGEYGIIHYKPNEHSTN